MFNMYLYTVVGATSSTYSSSFFLRWFSSADWNSLSYNENDKKRKKQKITYAHWLPLGEWKIALTLFKFQLRKALNCHQQTTHEFNVFSPISQPIDTQTFVLNKFSLFFFLFNLNWCCAPKTETNMWERDTQRNRKIGERERECGRDFDVYLLLLLLMYRYFEDSKNI